MGDEWGAWVDVIGEGLWWWWWYCSGVAASARQTRRRGCQEQVRGEEGVKVCANLDEVVCGSPPPPPSSTTSNRLFLPSPDKFQI